MLTVKSFFSKVFQQWMRKPVFHDDEHTERSIFKTAVDPNEPAEEKMTAQEQDIADRFEALDRRCKRYIERQKPQGWGSLEYALREHPQERHSHR